MNRNILATPIAVLFVVLLSVNGGSDSLADSSSGPLPATDDTRQITILHTNDNHGRFWKNRHGEYGMPARKTIIDQIRNKQAASGNVVLLLSGGDINTGVPESDIQDAEPDFLGMKAIGYDAMAVGNHEFDNPLSVLEKQQSWVNFPFLSANIYNRSTGKRLFKPYKLFHKDDLTIAVLGLTTDDTVRIGNPEFLTNVEFRSPVEEARSLVPELRSQADLVIAVTHMGHYQDGNHGTDAPGDVTLAREVSGIDLIIGGHSQEPVCVDQNGNYDGGFGPGKACEPDQQNGTWIAQAFEWGKYVGRADLSLKNGKVNLDSYSLIPVNLKVTKRDASGESVKDATGRTVQVFATAEIQEDAELVALLTPFQNKGELGLNVVVGQTDGILAGERSQVRFMPTNLGRLIAEAYRAKVNAEISIVNSGGIRASLDAGEITYKDILIVQPFGNTICKVSMDGQKLMEYLKVAAAQPIDTGAYPQFAGIDVVIENDRLVSATIGGKPIAPDMHFTMALNSFMAAGGDGYPRMDDKPGFINTGFVDADVVREYIVSNSPIAIVDYAPHNVTRK